MIMMFRLDIMLVFRDEKFVSVLKYCVGCRFVNRFIFLCRCSRLCFGFIEKFRLL